MQWLSCLQWGVMMRCIDCLRSEDHRQLEPEEIRDSLTGESSRATMSPCL